MVSSVGDGGSIIVGAADKNENIMTFVVHSNHWLTVSSHNSLLRNLLSSMFDFHFVEWCSMAYLKHSLFLDFWKVLSKPRQREGKHK